MHPAMATFIVIGYLTLASLLVFAIRAFWMDVVCGGRIETDVHFTRDGHTSYLIIKNDEKGAHGREQGTLVELRIDGKPGGPEWDVALGEGTRMRATYLKITKGEHTIEQLVASLNARHAEVRIETAAANAI